MEDALIPVTGQQFHDRCLLDRWLQPVDVASLANRAKRQVFGSGPINSRLVRSNDSRFRPCF